MGRIRYGRWTGTQDPFGPDLRPDDVLDALADDLLDGVDPDQAIEDLVRRGLDGRVAGLDELRRRLAAARRAELDRMGLEGPLQQIADRLHEVVELERTALQFSDDEADAAARTERLDRLPPDVAGQLSALRDYPFFDAGAQQAFDQLLDDLQRDVAQATFGRLVDALNTADPEDLARLRNMLAELNGLVARQQAGDDIEQDWQAFKERYDDLIPGDPETLDDLLEELARRMAAMSRLLAGLDDDQRRQLADLAEQVFGDEGLAAQAQQLTASLQQLFPNLGWDQRPQGVPQAGAEQGSISGTVEWLQHLQQMDDLDQALGQRYPGARLEDVDDDAVRAALGEDAVRDLSALKEIERLLERSGAVRRANGRLELTPRGVRRLGERSLAKIFERAYVGSVGAHRALSAGGDTELTGATRPLQFGDPFRIDVTRTITNAVRAGRAAPGGRVRLDPSDFELAEAERRVRAVTVLLLDMSFSMPLRGNWDPAKRMALALQSLIATKFPADRFHIVGFSDYARQLQPKDLLISGWERVWGTNMQHAFMIARRLLSGHPSTERHVIMVTDGEPTAHLLPDGMSYFNWPPHPTTLHKTMAEAQRLARTGASLNVFLLDHDPGSADFVEGMVRRVGGRVFYPDLADLGSVVVRDFLKRAT